MMRPKKCFGVTYAGQLGVIPPLLWPLTSAGVGQGNSPNGTARRSTKWLHMIAWSARCLLDLAGCGNNIAKKPVFQHLFHPSRFDRTLLCLHRYSILLDGLIAKPKRPKVTEEGTIEREQKYAHKIEGWKRQYNWNRNSREKNSEDAYLHIPPSISPPGCLEPFRLRIFRSSYPLCAALFILLLCLPLFAVVCSCLSEISPTSILVCM